eukprot:gene10324-8257_t
MGNSPSIQKQLWEAVQKNSCSQLEVSVPGAIGGHDYRVFTGTKGVERFYSLAFAIRTRLVSGADPFVCNSQWRAAIDLAVSEGQANILQRFAPHALGSGSISIKCTTLGGMRQLYKRRYFVVVELSPYTEGEEKGEAQKQLWIFKDSSSSKPRARLTLNGATCSKVGDQGLDGMVRLHPSHARPGGHIWSVNDAGYCILVRAAPPAVAKDSLTPTESAKNSFNLMLVCCNLKESSSLSGFSGPVALPANQSDSRRLLGQRPVAMPVPTPRETTPTQPQAAQTHGLETEGPDPCIASVPLNSAQQQPPEQAAPPMSTPRETTPTQPQAAQTHSSETEGPDPCIASLPLNSAQQQPPEQAAPLVLTPRETAQTQPQAVQYPTHASETEGPDPRVASSPLNSAQQQCLLLEGPGQGALSGRSRDGMESGPGNHIGGSPVIHQTSHNHLEGSLARSASAVTPRQGVASCSPSAQVPADSATTPRDGFVSRDLSLAPSPTRHLETGSTPREGVATHSPGAQVPADSAITPREGFVSRGPPFAPSPTSHMGQNHNHASPTQQPNGRQSPREYSHGIPSPTSHMRQNHYHARFTQQPHGRPSQREYSHGIPSPISHMRQNHYHASPTKQPHRRPSSREYSNGISSQHQFNQLPRGHVMSAVGSSPQYMSQGFLRPGGDAGVEMPGSTALPALVLPSSTALPPPQQKRRSQKGFHGASHMMRHGSPSSYGQQVAGRTSAPSACPVCFVVGPPKLSPSPDLRLANSTSTPLGNAYGQGQRQQGGSDVQEEGAVYQQQQQQLQPQQQQPQQQQGMGYAQQHYHHQQQGISQVLGQPNSGSGSGGDQVSRGGGREVRIHLSSTPEHAVQQQGAAPSNLEGQRTICSI